MGCVGGSLQLFNRRKAALDKAVRRIVDPVPGDRDPRLLLTVVLFGDGDFSPTAGGNRPSPYRQVRQALGEVATATVIMTDERYSTMVTSAWPPTHPTPTPPHPPRPTPPTPHPTPAPRTHPHPPARASLMGPPAEGGRGLRTVLQPLSVRGRGRGRGEAAVRPQP